MSKVFAAGVLAEPLRFFWRFMEDYFKIGVITTSHGVRGEMKVYPTTDDSKRFSKLKEVYLETKTGRELRKVVSVRYAGEFVLLKFEGIESPEEAVKYRQKGLFVDRAHAVKLQKDEYFVADLMGIRVVDPEQGLEGVLTEVIPTGANDVYAIQLEDGRELLLPAIAQCVLRVDVEEGLMQIHILDGLLDE